MSSCEIGSSPCCSKSYLGLPARSFKSRQLGLRLTGQSVRLQLMEERAAHRAAPFQFRASNAEGHRRVIETATSGL